MHARRTRNRWGIAAAALTLAAGVCVIGLAASAEASLGVAKSAVVTADRDGAFRISYLLRVTSFGTGEVREVTLEDDLAAALPGARFAGLSVESETAAVRPDFDGRTVTAPLRGTDALAAGKALAVDVVVRLEPPARRATYSNTAVAGGIDPAGRTVVDRSQDGADAAPDWDGDPTNNDAPTVVEIIPL